MNRKKLIMLFMVIGGYVGGLVPNLWGSGSLSLASIFCAAIGGFLGILLGFKIGE